MAVANKRTQANTWWQKQSPSISSAMDSAGVKGTNLTYTEPGQPGVEKPAEDPNMTVSQGSTIGLIPGTKAYATVQGSNQNGGGGDTSGSGGVPPDGGPTGENPAPGTGGGVVIGGPRKAPGVKKWSMMSGITIPQSTIDQIPEDIRANVVSALQAGGQTLMMFIRDNPQYMNQPWAQAIKEQLMSARAGAVRGRGVVGRAMANPGGAWQSWHERNYNPPVVTEEPAAPRTAIGVNELPPGYTPVNGMYDPNTGEPLITEAIGPDGSRWGIGDDGMPYQISPPLQAATLPLRKEDVPAGLMYGTGTIYPNTPQDPGFSTDVWPVDPYTGKAVPYPGTVTQDPGYITGTMYPNTPSTGGPAWYANTPYQLPPEMMQYMMTQLPYYSMYMAGMGPQYPPQY